MRSLARASLVITATVLAAGYGLVGGGGAEENEAEPFVLDLAEATPGEEPEGLFVVDGEFAAVEEGARTVLALSPEPLVEGMVLVGETLRGGGTIRAKIKAVKRGRLYPRFGVGLHGISGYRARVVPVQKKIELYKDEEVVAEASFAWDDSDWTVVELSVISAGEEKWKIEARAWGEGGERPGEPLAALEIEEGRFTGKAVLSGTPYSGTPILFDEVTVTPAGD